jgi:hypothetical protein
MCGFQKKRYTSCHSASKSALKKQDGSQRLHVQLDHLAESHEDEVQDAFHNANNSVMDNFTESGLATIIEQNGVNSTVVINANGLVTNNYNEILTSIVPVYLAAGNKTVQMLPDKAGLKMSFDISNPNSVSFLEQYKFNLVTEMSGETLNGMQQVIINGFEQGNSPAVMARQLKTLKGFGITQPQANAVKNYRANLESEMMKQKLRNELGVDRLPSGAFDAQQLRLTTAEIKRIDEQVAKYQIKTLNRRAKTIARTETIRAANEGQLQAWEQAQNAGLLDQDVVKFPSITRDGRTSNICLGVAAANPNGVVGIKTPYNFDPSAPPMNQPLINFPAHPNCRSTSILISSDGKDLT